MLEDHSSDLPPTGDLAATAQERGRRVRRRQAVGGALAGAALVALGFTVVPTLGSDDGPAKPAVLAASPAGSSAAPPVSRPNVDLASLPPEAIPESFSRGLDDFLISGSPSSSPPDVAVETGEGRIVYKAAGSLSARSIVGTVEGFSPLPERSGPSEGRRGVQMKVRLGSQIDDPSRLEERGLREGEVVSLWMGYVSAEDDMTGPLRRAVPKGTRMVAFEHVLPSPGKPSKEVRYVRNVVFENADGAPVAGPYFQDPPAGVWKQAKTFDAVLELAKKAVYKCATVELTKSKKSISENTLDELSSKLPETRNENEKVMCLRIRSLDPSGSPTVSPSPTAPGGDRPAVPTPSPTVS